MTGMAAQSKFSTWSAPGHALRIEYSAPVLEDIRLIAVEGYHRVPHGGVETGGILFGTQQKNVVRILAWRPIICEYAKGPSFLLTEKEETALADLLKSSPADPELASLEPVGWYRAHTRSEILLSEADLAFYNRFFPQPWQVGLIVRPGGLAPTRAGFFFREPDGVIRAQGSYREFILTPIAVAAAAKRPDAAEPPPAVREAPPPAVTPPEPQAVTPLQLPPLPDSPLLPPPAALSARWKWYALSLSLLVIAVLGFRLLPAPQGLKLTATDMKGQLRIAWDGAANPIGKARGGAIEIDDHGVRTRTNLAPGDLRSGSLFYERLSGDVAVRLILDVPGSEPIVETTRFLGPPGTAATTAPTAPAPEPLKKVQPLPLPPDAVPQPVRRIVPFRAPAETPRSVSTDLPGIPPPTLENQAAVPQTGPLPSVIASAPRPPAAPVPAAAAPVRAPTVAPTTPVASGRIIWTGKLSKNGRIVIERNQASAGAISAPLPAVAARVSAFPGELTAYGLTLFTPDPKYSQPLTERASAENGWNATTFTLDSKRAGGVKVVQQPGPQNGYKLVLQSDLPKVSVVLLEWRAQ